MDGNDFRHSYGDYFESIILKITWYQLCSKLFLNDYEGHWQWPLKDTLQLKIIRTRINVRAISFLGKYHETKTGEGAWEVISWTKIRACSTKNTVQRHFTYYCILLSLSNKPSFKIQPSVDHIVFATIYSPLYLLILCVSWSSSSAFTFFIRTIKVLMRLNVFSFLKVYSRKMFLLCS